MLIHDTSYKKYDGPIDTSHQIWRISDRNAKNYSLSPKTRLLRYALYVPTFFLPLVGVVVSQVWETFFSGVAPKDHVSTTGFISYFYIQYLCVTILFCGGASGVIADDRRFHTLKFYLSKPVTLTQYIIGKFFSLMRYGAWMTLYPSAILFGIWGILHFKSPLFTTYLYIALLSVAISFGILILSSSILLGLSSLSERRGVVILLMLATIVIPLVFTIAAALTPAGKEYAPFLNGFGLIELLAEWFYDRNDLHPPPWIPFMIVTVVSASGLMTAVVSLKRLVKSII